VVVPCSENEDDAVIVDVRAGRTRDDKIVELAEKTVAVVVFQQARGIEHLLPGALKRLLRGGDHAVLHALERLRSPLGGLGDFLLGPERQVMNERPGRGDIVALQDIKGVLIGRGGAVTR
jgi:hypothetical protein